MSWLWEGEGEVVNIRKNVELWREQRVVEEIINSWDGEEKSIQSGVMKTVESVAGDQPWR